MPPEPLPWDRKDFFKERKHERPEWLGSVARWRDTSPYHHGSRELARWGSADFRRPPGQGKQGGWHMFPEELRHGYVPSRSSDKIFEEESCRPSSRSGDGRYIRSSGENRGSSYSQKDWKGHSWETSNGSPSPAAARPFDVTNDQRPVDDMRRYNSHPPHTGFVNGWDQDHFKDQHDKMVVVNGLGANQRYERENSLGSINRKPLKWTRSGSLSARGYGYSHSSSSKSARVDSSEDRAELQPSSVTSSQSPSGDAVACVTSDPPLEETSSRKKPRLGWGEGLAKYEKIRVEGPNSNGVSSPRVTDFSDCASPTTPSSVACSSSPGMENGPYIKGPNTDNDTSYLIGSPCSEFQNHLEGLSLNIENLELNTIVSMGSSLIDMLQSDGHIAVISNFVGSTALNKMLLWKGDISKALEMTESEIDSLDNELKTLKAESGNSSCPAASSSLPAEGITKPCEEKGVTSSLLPRLTPLQLESSRDMIMEKTLFGRGAVVHGQLEAKDEDIESPGTATSKFVEPSSSAKGPLSSDMVKHVECPTHLVTSKFNDGVCDINGENNQNTDFFASVKSKVVESTNSAPVSLCTNRDDASLCDSILASNRESAYRAYEVFNKLLPGGNYQSDYLGSAKFSRPQNDFFIRGNFARRKQFLRFKERVIALKFRAFQHLWKEDIRLLSIRKNRAKFQKRFELSSRMSHSAFQKHPSYIRSRFHPPAGNLSLVPTTEMINFTSKLLSDSQVKLFRNTLKMPALILDKKKSVSRFLSSNGLVEDPHAVEKERAMINHWTSEEKKIFMDNLEAFGKDFRKIASFLDHKTTADCVEFYYKNHKSDSFEKTKKKSEIRKQGKPFSANTYMLTSGKKWNREMNAACLDILGAASVIAAHADVGAGNRQTCSGSFFSGGYSEYKKPQGDDCILEKSYNFDIMGKERETAAADVLASICGSLSSEAMSSCITSSVDPGEGYQDWKYQNVGSVRKRPLTLKVRQIVEDETCSDESCGEMDPSDWTDEEKSIFIQAISSYGKDFAKISRCVRSRSTYQCKIFFSKARKCLGLDMIHPAPGNVGSVSDDANGGGSDTGDACIVETGSVICSNTLDSKMDDDLPLPVLNVSHDESDLEGTVSFQTNLNGSEENNLAGEVDHTVSEAVENLVIDECQLENRQVLVSDEDNYFGKGVGCKSLMTNVQKVTVTSTATEDGRDQVTEQGKSMVVLVSSGETVDPCPSRSDTVFQTKSLAEELVNCDQTEGEGGEILLPENCFGEKIITIGQRSLPSSLLDTNMNPNAPLVAVETRPCPRLSFSANSQHYTPMELKSNQKPLSISQPNSFLTEASVSKDSAVLENEKTLTLDISSSTLGLEEIRNKQYQKSISVDDHYQHFSGHPILNHVESSQILSGYPVQIPIKKEMNGDIFGQKTSTAAKLRRYIAQECYLQKCNSSHSSVAGLNLLSQNLEQKNHHHPRFHSRSSSDPERPGNNGDFKLFGQVLNHPSSLQKVNSITQENDDNAAHPLESSSNSINLKFSSHQNIDGGLSRSKFDRNNYLGLENFAMGTLGFWDGNRIQTGFSAVPESAILRAKYSAAFSNYPSSSSKIEHQESQEVVKSNGGNLNGVSEFPTTESSANGVTDYQVYRSLDGNKLLPVMQRRDLLSEMQRLNGLDGVSSLLQQGRGIVGMNVVGRAGILVGGACPAVSDPVAAIKMHYAKAEQYGGQAGSLIGEEAWRCKGDIGR